MQASRPRWSPRTKLAVTLLLLAFVVFLLYRFRLAIKPFILAAILAYILSPFVHWFQERWKIRRWVATLLAYLILLVGVVVIPVVVLPPLAAQSANLNLDLQRFLSEIESLLGKHYIIAGQVIDFEALLKQVEVSIRTILEPLFQETLSFVIEAISSLVWIVFIVVVSFYLVKDAEALRQWLEDLAPPSYKEDFIHLRFEIGQIWSAFFRGQLVLALVVATIFTVVGLLLGLPFALAMGALAGLLEFLPSIGHGIWLIVASLLALFAGSTWLPIPNWVFMLGIIGLHLFFQQFDLNYLIPRIIGRRVHLPPLVVILGIVTGALLAGVMGIVLAAPTIASARVISRYIYALLFDREPFPTTVAPALPPPNPRWWRKLPAETEQPEPPSQGSL